MTFSVVARCPQSGMFGVAVSSSSPAVAARCAYARAGVGAVASQNVTDPRLGPMTLDLLAGGKSASEAIALIQQNSEHLAYRQLLCVDSSGGTAIHSGENALGIWSQFLTTNVASGGNMLANADVPGAIAESFAASSGHIGDRLINAMRTGLAAGGEAGPVHSAGMLLVDMQSWPVADIRCDWTDDCPIENIASTWAIYKPQLQDYIQRALNPGIAPTYGVPGDE